MSLVGLGRAAALLGAASASVHLALLGSSAMSTPAAAGMLLLAVGCLACSVGLWRDPKPRDWATAALLNLTMIALHVIWMRGMSAGGAPSHHASEEMGSHLGRHLHGQGLDLMHVATAIAACEVALTGLGWLLARRRGGTPAQSRAGSSSFAGG